MSIKTSSVTWACDWILQPSTDHLARPTYCPRTITLKGQDPVQVISPETERDLFHWDTVANGDKPNRHFCPEHAPLVKQMGLSR